MSDEQYCAGNGLLVGMAHPIMAPRRRPPTAEADALGCNHLCCAACGQPVRWFDARMWRPMLDRAEIARQYDQDDFAANLVTNKFSDKYRAYACRCLVRAHVGLDALEELRLDTDWPWACAGHEPPFDTAP